MPDSEKTYPQNEASFPDVDKSDKKLKKKQKQKRRRQNVVMRKTQRKQPLPQSERLKIAPKWLEEYDISVQGKNIIKAYRKRFHIEPKCALEELKMLNYPLTEEQIQKFHEAERNKVIQEHNKKRKRREMLEAKREARRLKKEGALNVAEMFPDSDDRFFFIAGYTSGGAPYGVTWEETNLKPYENPFDNADEND